MAFSDREWTGGRIAKYVVGGLAGLVALGIGARSCSCVPAGNVTVLDTFGNVSEQELESGFNWPVNPFATRNEMSIQTQELKETMKTPTSEGLLPTLEISVLYKLQPDKADVVYRTIGENYRGVIVEPGLRNAVRDVIAGFTSADLYSVNRGKIELAIFEKLNSFYNERGVTLEKVLMRDLTLPPQLVSAIENKMQEQQRAEQMEFTLQRETQEAERKAVEAGGIASAQQIIAESLTTPYLQWRYITTLETLAHSQNTTFVITPYNAENMLPLMTLPMEQNQTPAR